MAKANVERLRAGEPTKPAPAAPAVVRVRDLESKLLEIRRGMGLRRSTIHQDESAVRAHVVPLLGEKPVTDLQDTAVLLGFVDSLKAKGGGVSVIRNTLSVLRSFLDVARIMGHALAHLATHRSNLAAAMDVMRSDWRSQEWIWG